MSLSLITKSRSDPSDSDKKATSNSEHLSADELKNESARAWVDKHRPHNVADLPVHHSKIKAVKEWLASVFEYYETVHAAGIGTIEPHVLALCGNSGACKSSTVDVLCEEQGIEVMHYGAELWDVEGSSATSRELQRFQFSHPHEVRKTNSNDYSLHRSHMITALYHVDGLSNGRWKSKKENIESFALRSRYPSLLLSTKKKEDIESINEIDDEVSMNYNKSTTKSLSRQTTLSSTASYTSSYDSYDSSGNINLTSSLSRLQSNSQYDNNNQNNNNQNNRIQSKQQFQRRIIVFNELPVSTNNMQIDIQECIFDLIVSVQCPIIMILSDVSGRDDVHYIIDRYIPKNLKNIISFQFIYFPPITELRTVKVLETVLRKERQENKKKSSSNITLISKEGLKNIAIEAMGDIRHAITHLQYIAITGGDHMKFKHNTDTTILLSLQSPLITSSTLRPDDVIDLTNNNSSNDEDDNNNVTIDKSFINDTQEYNLFRKSRRKRYKSSKTADFSLSCGDDNMMLLIKQQGRDTSYSSLHGIAKLLNAKLDKYGKLQFLVDDIIPRCGMDYEMILLFLQWNIISSIQSIPNIGLIDNIEEQNIQQMITLQTSLELYSDMDLFLGRKYDSSFIMERSSNNNISSSSSSSASFPNEYIQSIISRTAAVAKGIGFQENYEEAKAKLGSSSSSNHQTLFGIKRPKILDLRVSVMKKHHELLQTQLKMRDGSYFINKKNQQHNDNERNTTLSIIISQRELILDRNPLCGILKEGSYDNMELVSPPNKVKGIMNHTDTMINPMSSIPLTIQSIDNDDDDVTLFDEIIESD